MKQKPNQNAPYSWQASVKALMLSRFAWSGIWQPGPNAESVNPKTDEILKNRVRKAANMKADFTSLFVDGIDQFFVISQTRSTVAPLVSVIVIGVPGKNRNLSV